MGESPSASLPPLLSFPLFFPLPARLPPSPLVDSVIFLSSRPLPLSVAVIGRGKEGEREDEKSKIVSSLPLISSICLSFGAGMGGQEAEGQQGRRRRGMKTGRAAGHGDRRGRGHAGCWGTEHPRVQK